MGLPDGVGDGGERVRLLDAERVACVGRDEGDWGSTSMSPRLGCKMDYKFWESPRERWE